MAKKSCEKTVSQNVKQYCPRVKPSGPTFMAVKLFSIAALERMCKNKCCYAFWSHQICARIFFGGPSLLWRRRNEHRSTNFCREALAWTIRSKQDPTGPNTIDRLYSPLLRSSNNESVLSCGLWDHMIALGYLGLNQGERAEAAAAATDTAGVNARPL